MTRGPPASPTATPPTHPAAPSSPPSPTEGSARWGGELLSLCEFQLPQRDSLTRLDLHRSGGFKLASVRETLEFKIAQILSLIFNEPWKLLCKLHWTLANSLLLQGDYRVVLIATHCYLSGLESGDSCSRCSRMTDTDTIFFSQHCRISPAIVPLRCGKCDTARSPITPRATVHSRKNWKVEKATRLTGRKRGM
jgi:hypothetical protein